MYDIKPQIIRERPATPTPTRCREIAVPGDENDFLVAEFKRGGEVNRVIAAQPEVLRMLAGIASERLVNADGGQFRVDPLEGNKRLLMSRSSKPTLPGDEIGNRTAALTCADRGEREPSGIRTRPRRARASSGSLTQPAEASGRPTPPSDDDLTSPSTRSRYSLRRSWSSRTPTSLSERYSVIGKA